MHVPDAGGAGLDRAVERWDARGVGLRWLDTAMIALAALFLLVPLGMVVMQGLPGLTDLPDSVLAAALRSVLVALGAAVLTVALALSLAFAILGTRARVGKGLLEGVGYLAIAASPLVVGTGLFILFFPFIRSCFSRFADHRFG